MHLRKEMCWRCPIIKAQVEQRAVVAKEIEAEVLRLRARRMEDES